MACVKAMAERSAPYSQGTEDSLLTSQLDAPCPGSGSESISQPLLSALPPRVFCPCQSIPLEGTWWPQISG